MNLFKKEPDLPLALAQQEKKSRKKLNELLFPPHKISPIGINMADTILILILLFIGTFTRIFRIQFPKEIVNNEDTIGQQINYYQSNQYFDNYQFPPVTSLFYYYISTLIHYDGQFNYTTGAKFCTRKKNNYINCVHIQFRTVSAVLTGFCPILIYLTVRIMFYLSSSSSTLFTIQLSSFVAAVLFSFETSLISQERYMFIDGFLHHCICASLFFTYFDNFYLMWHTFLFKCFYLSLSFSISPIHSFGLIFSSLIREFLVFKPKFIFKMNYALARSLSIVTFVVVFQFFFYMIHAKILPFKKLDFENEKVPAFIEKVLIDRENPDWKSRNQNQTILNMIVHSIYLMFHRSEIERKVKFESNAWNWPFGNFLKGIILYHHDNCSSYSHHYYACIPNIFVYLLVIVFVVVGIFLTIRNVKYPKKRKFSVDFLFLLIAYVTSIMPFFFVKHTFIYNYSVSLIFGILIISNVTEKLINPKYRVFIYSAAILMALIGYFLFAPYVYGLSRPKSSYFN